jgi:ditrans,polycis-polyprenyl diphosphate synthase
MDGNRRHAKQHSESSSKGHLAGLTSLKKCLEWCLHLGVQIVSVFAFSIENFGRAKEEVGFLMGLAKDGLQKMVRKGEFLEKNKVRVRVVGDLGMLEEAVR